jgi:thymidylate kinase
MNPRGRPLSPVEREFFEKFFRRLADSQVVSVLLRNYENFPAEMGNDLDVFFRRADLQKAVRIFRKTLRESGGEWLHVHERDYVLAVWFRAGRDAPSAIHLDFYHGAFTWHGLAYLNDDELLAASRQWQQFKIPRPAHEAANLFLTSLLWGGFFKARYHEQIRTLLAAPEEKAEFERIVGRRFGAANRPAFIFVREQNPTDKEMRRYAKRLRRAFRLCSFRRNPFVAAFRMSRYWLKELADVFSPPGIHIAVMGPDGSGKSTVIDALKIRIGYYFGETVDGHWRPSVLPDIGVLFGKREKSTGPATDPHGQSPHSPVTSALRFFYYWLDYWIGYPLRVWKPKAKNHLVIFDRYAPDMWCDARRYRLKLPSGLLKCFCRLVPQPDQTFILVADAETIHARKAELPLDTLRELTRRYAEAAKIFPRVQLVDCSRPANEVADEITAGVLNHLKARSRRHRLFRG